MTDGAQDFVNDRGGWKATLDALLADLESGANAANKSVYGDNRRFEFKNGTALIFDRDGWGFGAHKDRLNDPPPDVDVLQVPFEYQCILRKND